MKTILIVDDEPAARYGLRRALESKYRIVEADSAECARDALQTEKPDLVLLDVVLPGMDGLSFLKMIREQGSSVPVLMNPVTQAKVLRALENRTIERLGGTQSIPVDVRVISATHRHLPAEIRNGKFREDLFYRLRVVTIDLPPLRAHKEDVGVLSDAILKLHEEMLWRKKIGVGRDSD